MACAARSASRNSGIDYARNGVRIADCRRGGTEIVVAETAFGPSLAVGSGPFKNYTL